MANQRLVFFGNEQIATGITTTRPVSQALVAAGYKVMAVASKHQMPTTDELADFKAEAGILVAFGKIVPQTVIDSFPHGIINIHPSLLPGHRGSTPVESAILGGDKATGVSLMRLTAKMDAGPVYAQRAVPLRGDETKQVLADRLLELGKNMLLDCLPGILDGSLEPRPQDKSGASYDKLIDKADGRIDWQKPAERLEREIRAFAGWPKSRAKLGGAEVIITKAKVNDDKLKVGEVKAGGKRLLVGCGDGSLEILSLKPAGKPEMTTEAFLAGYKT